MNLTFAQEAIEYEQLCKDVSELLVTNNKSKFIKRFSPTKEDLLEFSYGDKADKIKKIERKGFFESITPTISMLEENISTSFDFIYKKLEKAEIQKVDNVEIKKSTKSKIGNSVAQDYYFVIYDGKNQFKIEILGIYKTSRDWIILTGLEPWYF